MHASAHAGVMVLAAFCAAGSVQVAARMAPWPMPDMGNLTATAILGWYAWHTASRTIPELIRDFRSETAAQREEFRAECNSFRAELAVQREQRHVDNQAMVDALNQLRHCLQPHRGP